MNIFPINKIYSKPIQIYHNINLNPIEKDIINILKSTCNQFQLNTIMRIAGGWVRDKVFL